MTKIILITIVVGFGFTGRVSAQVQNDLHTTEIIEDTTYHLTIGKELTVIAHFYIIRFGSDTTVYDFDFHSTMDSFTSRSITDTVEWYMGPAYFDLLDLTFDGYLDFRIPIDQSAHGDRLFRTYIFDPASKSYFLCVTCEKLPWDISLDTLQKKITFEGYQWYGDEVLTWQGEFSIINKVPVLTKYAEQREPEQQDKTVTPKAKEKIKKKKK